MQSRNYIKYVVEEIHTTIMATVDENGFPCTAAIDMMDYDDEGFYFLTAKGKSLYERLSKCPHIAFTAMKGKDTMSTIAVSVKGEVREHGPDLLGRLFEKNPYMNDIYPNEMSKKALTVFKIYRGTGEWFDLSRLPIERAEFSFGGEELKREGYFINDNCSKCNACVSVCPQNCIDVSGENYTIDQKSCLHCGACKTVCGSEAIDKL